MDAPSRAVVGDHEYRGRVGAPPDEIDDDLVGRATTGMANGDAGRDALAAQTGVGRTIEDELDRDGGRDRGAQPSDQRAGGAAAPPAERWQEFDPSTMSRSVSASGSRGVAIGRIVRGCDDSSGRRLRSAAWA